MAGTDLASWRDAPAKAAILDFVARATTPGQDLVAVADQIAAFDNDGTLWVEPPKGRRNRHRIRATAAASRGARPRGSR